MDCEHDFCIETLPPTCDKCGLADQSYKHYEVLFPHVRSIGGTLVMFDPLLCGIVCLKEDEETKACVAHGWLNQVDPRET